MKTVQTATVLLLAVIPALAADSIYGVWKMRPDRGGEDPAARL